MGVARRWSEPPSLRIDLAGPLDALPATDWLVHLAGGYAGASRRALEREEATMTRRLLEWSARRGVRRWIFASAAEVYGPCREAVSEDAPTRPVLPYGRVKLDLERTVAGATAAGVLEQAVVLRIGEVYGATGNLVEELTRRFQDGFCPWFGSGAVPVSFVHVEDVAATFVRAVEKAPPGHSTWNVADDRPTTWRAFLDEFARLLGARRAVGLPPPMPCLYAAGSTAWDRLRRRSPVVTRHIVTLLTTPKVMSNRKLRDGLGFDPIHPDYVEGLGELVAAEGRKGGP